MSLRTPSAACAVPSAIRTIAPTAAVAPSVQEAKNNSGAVIDATSDSNANDSNSIVATVNDSIYAFDADDWTRTDPYWQTNFLGPNVVAPRSSDMTGACGGNYQDFHGNMGIVGTPVIDPASGTLYVVVRTKENTTTYVQRLRALDIATGLERSYSPVVITATYPGTGDGSVGGVMTFNPQKQNQRWGLALVNGIVYVGWASHCDWGPYHGWLIGYAATNLSRLTVYNTTPNGGLGGIWQAGGAPASDANGYLYFETGNGTFSSPRLALLRMPPFKRACKTCSSASDMVPLSPSNKRSLKVAGS